MFTIRTDYAPLSTLAFGFLLLITLGCICALGKDTGQQYPHDFNYTINQPEICNSGHDIRLLIMVHSAGEHVTRRLAIRDTWGSVGQRKDVRLLFLLGFPTKEEVQQRILGEDSIFGDILQEDFLDTYYNLTLKTIMMVKWMSTHCPRARYLLKIDNDCFLNTDSMLAFLNQNLTEVAIYGRVWKNYKPHRDKRSKWYMPTNMYPERRYPDFAAGPSYLLTQKAVPLLYDAALTTKSIYLEDVYLNGICAEKAKIPRINNEGFYVLSTQIKTTDQLRSDVLTSHEFSSELLRLLWWLLNDARGAKLNNILVSKGKNALEK